MRISREEVDHVAELARLGLSEEERERFRDQLSAILGYVAQLNELDTSQVPPAAQVVPLENVTRPDEVRPSLSLEQVLANAPARFDAYFRVPPVFDEA
jgi:aspartyl-tRNA(Asn)/glutamyl-tRNA(Gln) amidotransferase subunit C